MKYKKVLLVFVVAQVCLSYNHCSQDDVYRDMLEGRTQNFTQIANEVGYTVNEYDVITQDSYILKLFHIPGDRTRPVLLMHGVIDSADTFIIRKNNSLAIVLAKAGYDVWIGNTRGNRYSRRHTYLDPDVDTEFWDYTFEEVGIYDLPAIIDFILDRTGEKSLSAIGHSQGNTIFFVLGSMRPEYNEKFRIMLALSPICFLNNIRKTPALLVQSASLLDKFLTLIGEEELMGDDSTFVRLYKVICGCKNNYALCAHGILFPLAGSDPEELEADFLPTVIAHYPSGTSRKNAVHTAQVGLSKRFSRYDYDWRNMDVYNSSVPPDFDLSKVTMKVVLLAGRNDNLSTLEDIKLLNSALPNIVEYIVIEHKKFNHIDAVWGRNMDKYLFPHILEVLTKYGG